MSKYTIRRVLPHTPRVASPLKSLISLSRPTTLYGRGFSSKTTADNVTRAAEEHLAASVTIRKEKHEGDRREKARQNFNRLGSRLYNMFWDALPSVLLAAYIHKIDKEEKERDQAQQDHNELINKTNKFEARIDGFGMESAKLAARMDIGEHKTSKAKPGTIISAPPVDVSASDVSFLDGDESKQAAKRAAVRREGWAVLARAEQRQAEAAQPNGTSKPQAVAALNGSPKQVRVQS